MRYIYYNNKIYRIVDRPTRYKTDIPVEDIDDEGSSERGAFFGGPPSELTFFESGHVVYRMLYLYFTSKENCEIARMNNPTKFEFALVEEIVLP